MKRITSAEYSTALALTFLFALLAPNHAKGQVPGRCVWNCGSSSNQRSEPRERNSEPQSRQGNNDPLPPHVLRRNGKLYPAPGFQWLNDVPGDYRVKLMPGLVNREGYFQPAPGYEWVTGEPDDYRVTPKPGLVLGEDDRLHPAHGYEWLDDDPHDFRVILTSERRNREARERAERERLERERLEREKREAEELAPMGNAGNVVGDVQVFRADTTLRLEHGNMLRVGDRVVTGHGAHLQVILRDETVFTIGEDADMVLDEFVYDPDRSPTKVGITFLRGVFRWVTGKVARATPRYMKVGLAVGAIGIRGTDFKVTVLPNGNGFIQLFSGDLEITERKTRRLFSLHPMQVVTFTAVGKFGQPAQLKLLPSGEPEVPKIQAAEQEVRFSLERSDPDYPWNITKAQLFNDSWQIQKLGDGQVVQVIVKPGERWGSRTYMIKIRALVTVPQISLANNPLPPTRTEENDVYVVSKVTLEVVRVLVRPGQIVHDGEVLFIARTIGN